MCQLWGCESGAASTDTPCDDNHPGTLHDHSWLKQCTGSPTFFSENSQIATRDVLMLPDDAVIAASHNKAGKAAALRSQQENAAQ